ncbi:MAG TPA: thiamine pyrophosphate-dependent dehydrogenase E1 component subunit alpha [Candidatus Acidoferrum sp.]|nr:thiamine pyrophosphate-dependent dehydrogenase E1 component subunit alpha [Candidatus Acidoferrum sp.]
MDVEPEILRKLYESMVRIRTFEQRAEQLFLDKKIPGFIHLYIGQEAIAAGVISQLRADDYLTSTHRGHGHMLAKGADSKRMMAELLGKSTGYCKGKGGSMHIMDFSLGVLGANGEVAGGIPIAAGAGMAIRLVKKTDQVVACFFGDGASNRGAFHEGLNWAAVYRLPIVFVAEHNCFASTMPTTESTAVKDISTRAQSYNMEGSCVDGNDVLQVYRAARQAIQKARQGGGPTLIEAKTYRLKGHYVGDPQKYRDPQETEARWQDEPIRRFERHLLDRQVLSEETRRSIWQRYETEIEEAVRFAESSPYPRPEEALTDLFLSDAGYEY